MAISIVELRIFEGPNLAGPQPGVLATVAGAGQRLGELPELVKDAAQRVGVVVGYLQASPAQADLAELYFATPTPALGAELVRYAVDALRADAAFDGEDQLWALQRRRRSEALPLPAMQLIAEASRRGIPSFQAAGGALQLGYGARGMALALARPAAPGVIGVEMPGMSGAAEAIDWGQLGRIPITACAGGPACADAARLLAGLAAGASAPVLVAEAGFDQVRAALADPALAELVLSLRADELAARGLPFESCSACAIVGLPDLQGAPEERARVAGLPLLVTEPHGVAALDADTPEIAALAGYASCPVVLFGRDAAALSDHRGRGGAAVYASSTRIIGARGTAERVLGAVEPGLDLAGQLAAWAVVWGRVGAWAADDRR